MNLCTLNTFGSHTKLCWHHTRNLRSKWTKQGPWNSWSSRRTTWKQITQGLWQGTQKCILGKVWLYRYSQILSPSQALVPLVTTSSYVFILSLSTGSSPLTNKLCYHLCLSHSLVSQTSTSKKLMDSQWNFILKLNGKGWLWNSGRVRCLALVTENMVGSFAKTGNPGRGKLLGKRGFAKRQVQM